MAQKKMAQLEGENKRSVAQKARRARELKTISEMADANLADTEQWRTLLPEHLVAIKYRTLGGDTLGNICRDLGIPRAAVCNYIFDNPAYAKEWRSFRAFSSHMMYDDLVEMIDNKEMSPGDKMFAYKVISHLAPRLNPEDYSETTKLDQSVTINTPVMPDWFFGSVQDGQLSDGSDPTI